jgi:predicted dehydrogenase
VTKLDQQPIRAAVIGAGFFGAIHARKYAALPGVELVAVADRNPEKAEAVAAALGTTPAEGIEELLGRIDVLTVATPASEHYPPAKTALEAGVHTLVEKPLALTLDHADELISLARARDLVLQVGHQERYVFAEFGLLSRAVAPRRLAARRAGPFTGRGTDVSVVLDLMIHDLDLMHQIIPSPVKTVEARARFEHGGGADEVIAHLSFENGAEAAFTASRIAEARGRTMEIDYDDGRVAIDFIARTLDNTTPADLVPAFGGEAQVNGKPAIANDPVGHAVAEFIEAVRLGRAPLITGGQGRRALETALRIMKAAGDPLP